jgi:hypothetical protein
MLIAMAQKYLLYFCNCSVAYTKNGFSSFVRESQPQSHYHVSTMLFRFAYERPNNNICFGTSRSPHNATDFHLGLYEITNHAAAELNLRAQQEKWKYLYMLNISEALKTCHDFLLMDKRILYNPDVIGWIVKAQYCPMRTGKNYAQKKYPHRTKIFNCR